MGNCNLYQSAKSFPWGFIPIKLLIAADSYLIRVKHVLEFAPAFRASENQVLYPSQPRSLLWRQRPSLYMWSPGVTIRQLTMATLGKVADRVHFSRDSSNFHMARKLNTILFLQVVQHSKLSFKHKVHHHSFVIKLSLSSVLRSLPWILSELVSRTQIHWVGEHIYSCFSS